MSARPLPHATTRERRAERVIEASIFIAALQLFTAHFATKGQAITTQPPLKRFNRRSKGVLAVEMEAAALYTFAHAVGVRVLHLAHVTNTMGQSGQDFQKGAMDGAAEALAVIEAIADHHHTSLPHRAMCRSGRLP